MSALTSFTAELQREIDADDSGGRRTVELGRAFANESPVRVVCEVLGFPSEAQDQFYSWGCDRPT